MADPHDASAHGGGHPEAHALNNSAVHTGALDTKSANATADITLTTSFQDVTGATISLDKNGKWLVFGTFDVETGDGTEIMVGVLTVDGVDDASQALLRGATGTRITIPQMWLVTITGQPKTANIRARKTGGGTTWVVRSPHSSIRAAWMGS